MAIDKTISKILQGFQPACVVITANELKVFDQLKQPADAEHVAENCHLDPEATERLLNALTSLEIITKKNNMYHLPQAAQNYLEAWEITENSDCAIGYRLACIYLKNKQYVNCINTAKKVKF